jgi:hypothetical protein
MQQTNIADSSNIAGAPRHLLSVTLAIVQSCSTVFPDLRYQERCLRRRGKKLQLTPPHSHFFTRLQM